ncbi:MAG: hypothetical protein ACI8WB_001046 [Phenylobacterium sp.]|jgi:hypothetical protein
MHSSLKAFLFGCLCILGLAWLSSVQSLHWINLKIHDHALSLPLSVANPSDSLIINNDLPFDQNLASQLDQLIVGLSAHNAKHIVLLTRSALVAQTLIPLKTPLKQSVWLATPADIITTHPSLKPVSLFDLVAIDGTYRQYQSLSNRSGLAGLYQDAIAFSEPEPEPEPAPAPIQYLNYFLDISNQPNLLTSQALNGSLIDELVSGKVVLIDLDYGQSVNRFYIAKTRSGHQAALGELQALAAQTWLNGSDIQLTSAFVTLILLLAVFSVYFFSLQLLPPKGIFVFAAILILLTYGLALLSLFKWQTLIPAFELIAVQFLSVVYLLTLERLSEESVVLKMSAELNARLSQKVQPPSFYQSDEPWDNLHTLINQQLNLHRSIFLSKVPEDHRVKAIHALNCELDDIEEMRRDYERMPYSEAVSTQKPVKLQKQYFNLLEEGEVEYIAPLIFAGKVLGFWALTVKPGEDWQASTFENNLLQFSSEITELLYHRQRYVEQEKKDNNFLRRFFTLKLAQVEYESLNNSVSMLEKRFDSLQDVFDGMSTASALYNLFGQIVHSNREMDEIAKNLQMPIYALTAHDFLLKITSLDSQQIKQHLIQVTIEHSEVSLRIKPQDLHADYILRIRPVNTANTNDSEGVPFLLLGLLFEFIDVSDAQRIITMKKDLYGQYFHQMRNSLSTMNLFCRQIRKKLPATEHEYIDLLEESLNEMSKVDWLIEDQLELQRSLTPQVIPLNPLSELQNVTDRLLPELTQKRITLALKAPTVVSLVMAPPQQLGLLFELIGKILIDDSDSNGSTLAIVLHDSNKQSQRVLSIAFSNEGYGVPEEHLARILDIKAGQHGGGDELLEQLVFTANHSDYWGLKLTVASTLGSGYTIGLSIPVFSI